MSSFMYQSLILGKSMKNQWKTLKNKYKHRTNAGKHWQNAIYPRDCILFKLFIVFVGLFIDCSLFFIRCHWFFIDFHRFFHCCSLFFIALLVDCSLFFIDFVCFNYQPPPQHRYAIQVGSTIFFETFPDPWPQIHLNTNPWSSFRFSTLIHVNIMCGNLDGILRVRTKCLPSARISTSSKSTCQHSEDLKQDKKTLQCARDHHWQKRSFFLKNRKKPGHLIDEKNWHIVEKKGAKKTSLQSVFLYFLKEVVRDPEAYCKQKLSWQFVEKWQVGWQFVEKKPWSWHPIDFFFLQSVKVIKTPPK